MVKSKVGDALGPPWGRLACRNGEEEETRVAVGLLMPERELVSLLRRESCESMEGIGSSRTAAGSSILVELVVCNAWVVDDDDDDDGEALASASLTRRIAAAAALAAA